MLLKRHSKVEALPQEQQVPRAVDALRRAFSGDVNVVVQRYVNSRAVLIREKLLDSYRRKLDDALGKRPESDPNGALDALRILFLKQIGRFETLISDELRSEIAKQPEIAGDPEACRSAHHLLEAQVKQICREFRLAVDDEIARVRLVWTDVSAGAEAAQDSSEVPKAGLDADRDATEAEATPPVRRSPMSLSHRVAIRRKALKRRKAAVMHRRSR